jgi:hypothetical protein
VSVAVKSRVLILPATAVLLSLAGPSVHGQNVEGLPFGVGERMVYRARVASVGTVGHGAMWVEGPVTVRGVSTLVLRFDMSAGFGPVKASDRTSSWLDTVRMTSLRFAKRERSPVANHEEEVELYPDETLWRSAAGVSGATQSNRSLDELSFIYYIRTLPLTSQAVYRIDRHFDAARNPTSITVIRREAVRTPAGEFQTILVEMRVKDSRRYKDTGIIRINLSDDARRIPVRIASSMRVLGTVVLTLESYRPPAKAGADSRVAQLPHP